MIKCSVVGCEKSKEARGFCSKHYYRWQIHGDPNISHRRPNGSGYVHNGYLIVRDKTGKQVKAHRLIMEKILGRKLKPFPIEVVHHIDGNRLNNKPSNLEIISQSNHGSFHNKKSIIVNGKKRCTKCNKFLSFEKFCKQASVKDGLKSICRTCHSIHYHQKYQKIKNENLAQTGCHIVGMPDQS